METLLGIIVALLIVLLFTILWIAEAIISWLKSIDRSLEILAKKK